MVRYAQQGYDISLLDVFQTLFSVPQLHFLSSSMLSMPLLPSILIVNSKTTEGRDEINRTRLGRCEGTTGLGNERGGEGAR
eukprot:764834-Hanusia_phi.AAC.1